MSQQQSREWWMNNTREKVDGQMAYKKRYHCGPDAFKVIEYIYYEQLLCDARKLRQAMTDQILAERQTVWKEEWPKVATEAAKEWDAKWGVFDGT